MNKIQRGGEPSPAKTIAAIAVITAMLIGGQLALSFVSGVEVVTVLLLTFSFSYGRKAGVLAAVSFSLLRCFIWGFSPSVVLLYIIYYPLFAFVFGSFGRVKAQTYENFPAWAAIAINIILVAVGTGCVYCAATDFLKISLLSVVMIKTLLWVIFALDCGMLIAFDVVFIMQKCGRLKNKNTLKVVAVTATATVFTVFFSLLDDFITTLIMGWGLFSASAATYFYGSFLAMVPQTVCTIVSVSALFMPLTAIFSKSKGMKT